MLLWLRFVCFVARGDTGGNDGGGALGGGGGGGGGAGALAGRGGPKSSLPSWILVAVDAGNGGGEKRPWSTRSLLEEGEVDGGEKRP